MMTRLVHLVAVSWLLAAGSSLEAQIVAPRTVPVFNGNQFGIIPSTAASMGGVSIALDDSIGDAFTNPAKAARLKGMLFAAPFSHSLSSDRGGGKTIPLGGVGTLGEWTFATVYATQEINRAGPMRFSQFTSDRTANNQYFSLSAARKLPGDLSLGVSGSFAALGAVDGVDLLYSGSDRINQLGSSSDIRVGLTKEIAPKKQFEFLVVHSRSEMTHKVHFPARTIWSPATTPGAPPQQRTTPARDEVNDDRTHILGAHAEYTQPLGTQGWTIGWLATANRLTHPHIPTYVLENVPTVPRDPGHSNAFNLGVGIGKTRVDTDGAVTTFGVDLILEPISSSTWGEALNDTAVVGGGTIKAGQKTVENAFAFHNQMLRVGFANEFRTSRDSGGFLGFQVGLARYGINYRLEQQNNITKSFRTQDEHWTEWTPTFGLSYRSREMAVHYNYSRTCSSECVSFGFGGDKVQVASPNSGSFETASTIIVAPNSPLTFASGSATSHKFWISIPVR
jgi:hypothetical protein